MFHSLGTTEGPTPYRARAATERETHTKPHPWPQNMLSRERALVLLATSAAAAAYLYYRRRAAGSLKVRTYADKHEMASTSAKYVAEKIRAAVAGKGSARIIVATGSSQFEFIASLVELDVPWDRVTCFHLDEYCDLAETHAPPQQP